MPIKYKPTQEIRCLCGRNTVVDIKPATAYCEVTRFFCDCGNIYHIHDNYNGIITWQLVTKEFDDIWRDYCKDSIAKHTKTLEMSFIDQSAWQDWLDRGGYGGESTVNTFTVDFSDCGEGDIKVDIKLCDDKEGKPFIDPVIFKNGHDVGCLEARDTIAGEYRFNMLKDDYVVIIPDVIKEARDCQGKYKEIEKWLQTLDDNKLQQIDFELKKDRTPDREYLIESILEECKNNSKLDDLFSQSKKK